MPMKQEICLREAEMANQVVFCLDRIPTPLGEMLVVTDAEERLRAADFWDYESRMLRLLRLHYGANGEGGFALRVGSAPPELRARFDDYFEGDLRALDDIEVATSGTEFQRDVWAALRTIRPGETLSYGELAIRLQRPRAVRAVGLANGSNPVSVVVPCHRVIGSDKSLTGYGGGIERKRWLLVHEGALHHVAVKDRGDATG
jgi:methylated-DNA-[protein]-cysteine S-methyltransferase